ncbi:prolipoprotein diacylglyceryl transferase [Georgenia sp. Z1491]|uniref:prolipoprotein diacylglyceryl transferase n=1 Tax=Georgenia sp. Z1491 TaxID=3416707 RepID=UPI003CE6852B
MIPGAQAALASAGAWAGVRGIPSPPENVWYLGPFPLRAYALAIILGAVLAWWILDRRYTAKGGPAETALDIALYWMVPFGIVGSRIYEIAVNPQNYFGEGISPWEMFKVWEGGLGIMGAVTFGALGAYLGLRRRGLRIGPFADALAPGMLVAQAVGRLGNYFNQELYGTATDLPWGLRIDRELPELVHPTFLYEGLWNLAGALVLVLAQRRLRLDGGRVFWLYVIIWLTGRTLTESLRTDPSNLVAGMRIHQIIAIAGCVIGVAMIVWLTRRARATPDRDEIWLPGRGPLATAEGPSAAGAPAVGDTAPEGEGTVADASATGERAASDDEPERAGP